MVQTFSFTTETTEKIYRHTIHAFDIKSAVDKWVIQIEDLQNQVYSFNSAQVQSIKNQYSKGELKVHFEKEPFSLTFLIGNSNQVVTIERLNKGKPDFIAKVTYLTTEQGGRKGYASSGYRPHVKFEGKKELTSGEQLFVDKDKVFPGETVIAEIRIIGLEFFKNYLYVGQHFEVAEASHLVGHGEILEIINLNLQKASR